MEENNVLKWLKFAFAALLLFFAYRQIDRQAWTSLLSQIHLGWALLAMLCLALSQAVGGLRMQYFLRVRGVTCKTSEAIRLYYRGMLYNLLLPGGISGDGYRVYVLRQRYPQLSVTDLLRMVFSERANGLLVLSLVLLMLLAFTTSIPCPPLALLLVGVLGMIGYVLMLRIALKEQPRTAMVAAFNYSLPLQCLSLLAALAITYSLAPQADVALLRWAVIVFLASAIAATIPITLGGLGLREVVFMAGFAWRGYPESLGVTIASVYYLCYLVVALLGAGVVMLEVRQKQL
jgi:uncharacterized membrane protein YbhN (UPF0104 family)